MTSKKARVWIGERDDKKAETEIALDGIGTVLVIMRNGFKGRDGGLRWIEGKLRGNPYWSLRHGAVEDHEKEPR
jgi:hypothetical protein